MTPSFSSLMGMRINIPNVYKDEEDVFVPLVLDAIQRHAIGFWDKRLFKTIYLNEIFTRDWDFTTTADEMINNEAHFGYKPPEERGQ